MNPDIVSHFLAGQSHVKDVDLATNLHSIKVVRKRHDDTHFVRLVGRDRSLDLVLATPSNESLVAFAELHLALDSGWDEIVSVDGFCGCCFADVAVFIRQIGLDQWRLIRTSPDCRLYGYRSWV